MYAKRKQKRENMTAYVVHKIRKISKFCLKSGQNVWSHVCGV